MNKRALKDYARRVQKSRAPQAKKSVTAPKYGDIGYGNKIEFLLAPEVKVDGTVEAVADNGKDVLIRTGDDVASLEWTTVDKLNFISLKKRRTKFGDQQDYQDKLRVIEWRKEGKLSAKEIAEKIQRGKTWVKKYWNLHPNQIPKPANLEIYRENAWMDPKLKRGYGKGQGLYEKILSTFSFHNVGVTTKETYGVNNWKNVTVRKCPGCEKGLYDRELKRLESWKENRLLRDKIRLRTCRWCKGESAYNDGKVKYCSSCKRTICIQCHNQCKQLESPRQSASYEPGLIPDLDALVAKIQSEFRLPQATRTFFNFYEDGTVRVGKHRHDNWTLCVSFGAPRILSVDYQEVLMEDGDLLMFGTQKHGVPVMDHVKTGRISMIMMWEPTQFHLSGRWRQ